MSSTGISAAALILANEAQHDAKVAKCNSFMKGFENDKSTIEAKQEYSECIQLIHPLNISNSDKKALGGTGVGVFLLFCLLFMFFHKYCYKDIGDTILLSFISLFGVGLGFFMIYGLYICIGWVLL